MSIGLSLGLRLLPKSLSDSLYKHLAVTLIFLAVLDSGPSLGRSLEKALYEFSNE